MCGIAGVVDHGGRPIGRERLERMCRAIAHRGPDDEGLLLLEAEGRPGAASVGLGSRRLSIIDVAGGRQPIANEDRTVWTVLNGELYNFQELRAELEAAGHRFATKTDTEVIVHLYEEEGERFVRRLDGMFALAVWDARRQRLLLARDRLGKKPLLYARQGERLWFGSEFQALLTDGSIPRELDADGLDAYLAYGVIPAPLTIFRQIRKLPPAHLLIADAAGTTIQRYWSLAYTPKLAISEDDAAERAGALLSEAVGKRLISEVPLGALLSGGVDSSVVVACMARRMSRPVKTFSIGFEEAPYNELPHARRVAERFGCEHHEFTVSPQAIDLLPRLVQHFGEPFADSSALPTFALAAMTRQHVTVALSGDGGDEVFGGYERHLAGRMAEAWQRGPRPLRRGAAWLAGRLVSRGAELRSGAGKLRRFLEAAELSRSGRYRAWVGMIAPALKASLAGAASEPRAGSAVVEALIRESDGLDAVDAALAVDTGFYLPSDLLVKMDITSMANSLEVRSPLLDHHLVEFVARLPSGLKVRGRVLKYLLKRVAAGMVPARNLERPKQGFAVPVGAWLRNGLRDFAGDHLEDSRAARDGLISQAALRPLLAEHWQGRADHARPLWALLILECWYRAFVRG